MNHDLIILDGCTFMYSDGCGDVEAKEAEGFFYEDVRHLSRWLLRVEGEPLVPLTSRRVDHYSARIVGARQDGDAPPVSVLRDRFVTEGMHEDVVLPEPSRQALQGQAGGLAAVPIEYPDALKPQSWAAAAPLLAIRTLLGLDVVNGKLRSRPHLPAGMQKLQLNARVRGSTQWAST
jgi:hypothetical protein